MPTKTLRPESAPFLPVIVHPIDVARDDLVALARAQLAGGARTPGADASRAEEATEAPDASDAPETARPCSRSTAWRWADLSLALGLVGLVLGIWATQRLPLSAALVTVPFIGEAVLWRVERRVPGGRPSVASRLVAAWRWGHDACWRALTAPAAIWS